MNGTISNKLVLAGVALLIAVAACAPADRIDPGAEAALATITTDDLVNHVLVLGSDEFEGRFPGTPGEQKTLEYLQAEAERIGLQPGAGDGWFQEVQLVSITADPGMTLSFSGPEGTNEYAYGTEFMAWTTRVVEQVEVGDSELIFVGYGTVAPEYGWNDYEGIDASGKTVVMLVNDPGFATQDPALFNGRSMTYYGRWTYKYEEAARQGAAAALIIHDTEPAAYGWATVEGSWSGPQLNMVSEDNNMGRVKVEGWLQLEVAREVFAMAGLDLDELSQQASQGDFNAVPMGVTASTAIRNTVEHSTSHNVLGILPGSERPDEYVIYMGHWDHLGMNPALEGDQIFNGAADNASGTAAVLELAEAFVSLETRPKRSIVFWWTTAEEQGLLGSAYYAANPIYPLEKTAGAINIDGLNIYGPMRDIYVIGYGNSELDEYLIEFADWQNREVKPDAEAEKGYFYRSDHFPLAKMGVPALYTDVGDDHVEHGEAWTQQRKDEWTARQYHQPSDEYSEDWDLTGAVDDLHLWFLVGYKLANESTFPSWNEGTEFKAIRDAMMGGTD
ncbi:MAG: M28 family peptidase [Gemmatimonadetes bacterium]|nr:M28 family peptidase [Gemmatimonadota bacterium]NIO30243.1 M28 family peptidase [Gemmatimonadota bacterium]